MSNGKFQTLRPIKVTPAILLDSNVPENDAPVWVSGTNYAQFSEVIYNHVIYTDGVGGVSTKPPPQEPDRWPAKNPTNRWMAFDDTQFVHTKQANHMWFLFKPGRSVSGILPVSLRNVDYYTVTMRDPTAPSNAPPLYSRSFTFGLQPTGTSPYHYFRALWRLGVVAPVFDDLPMYPDATLRIDFYGGANMEVGPICFGEIRSWGEGVLQDPTLAPKYRSKDKEDDYGKFKRIKRGWYGTASLEMLVKNSTRSEMSRYFIDIRDDPCVLILSNLWADTRYFGTMVFKERLMTRDYSKTEISIMELTHND